MNWNRHKIGALFAGAFVWAAAIVLVVVAANAVAETNPNRCGKTYTRAHFHAAAKSTYRTAFPPARKVRTLNRIQRCQRYRKSLPIVREHRGRYQHAWRVRFYWDHEFARIPAWLVGTLSRIAQCESGGNPGAVSPGGTYRGLFQFDYQTWGSVGGAGDPAAAPAKMQYVLAARLYNTRGAAPWPVCGQ
jgi:hypothetical protein